VQILIVAAGIAALLLLILRFKLPAFLVLLIVSAGVGLALGMDTAAVIKSITNGMASTLGFIAVVVGLGSMFGALLEYAGGVRAIADNLLKRASDTKASWALGCAGLLIGIPVFFDVAIIILAPLIHQLSARTGRSPLHYAAPLMAGLLVGHAFIPPTPGPLAVAELLGADLGWVIGMGLLCGIPAMIVAGPVLAHRFKNIAVGRNITLSENNVMANPASTMTLTQALFAIVMPLALIVGNTAGQQLLPEGALRTTLSFVGHPFMALLLSCLYVYVVFGTLQRVPANKLQEVMNRALEPAGMVVLVTGAGGVFKQILVDSGVGDLLGAFFSQQAIPPMLLAFVLAALIRIAQGSATVAMITSAGLVAPILQHLSLDQLQTALVVIAIASGASIASHVNDSGFWLVSRCLNLTEAETLRSWTVISTVAALTGFAMASLLAIVS
jgi:Gnt-I system low-affinity gluconate transporter